MKPATRIGPYELLDSLGEGGMGQVYRARDTRLGRIVAVKFLQARSVANHRRQMRFLREAKAEAALSHPNIATLLDVGEAEVDDPNLAPAPEAGEGPTTVPYLVIEYVPGRDLHALLESGPLPISELLRIGRQIASGLKAAHHAGIVHRDLKPGNIRVTPDGRVKILDFGLALFIEGAAPTSDTLTELATSEGVVVGTVPYLAPEQAAGSNVDARADLFSLGVLLYELACGQLPFRGVSTVDRLRAVLQDEPPPLEQRVAGLPPRFAELVHRLLAKEATDRPRDAGEVEQELEMLSREFAEARTSTTLSPLPRAHASGPARSLSAILRPPRPARLGLAATAAVVLIAAAGWLWWSGRHSLDQARDLIAQGRRAAALEDPQASRIAAGMFERATRIRPKLAEAWSALAGALADSYSRDHMPELLERAEQAAERAHQLDPDATSTRLVLARLTRLRGRVDEALAMLEKIPRKGPELSDLERQLAEIWQSKGDNEKAEEHMLASVAARPDAWNSWNALGSFRIDSGNYPGARAAFEKAKQLAPAGVTIPEENLALLLYLQGKYAEALAAYEKIDGPVANADSATNLGALYFATGRFADAAEAFRRAIRIAPRDPLYHRNLADALLRLGEQQEARDEYATALRLVDGLLRETPQDTGLQLSRLLYLARSGDCGNAVAEARRLAASLPASPETAHGLARPFALCGATAPAIEQVRRALELGYSASRMRDEDELAPLRADPEFRRLVRSSAGS